MISGFWDCLDHARTPCARAYIYMREQSLREYYRGEKEKYFFFFFGLGLVPGNVFVVSLLVYLFAFSFINLFFLLLLLL